MQKNIPKEIYDELIYTFETYYITQRLFNIAERYDFMEHFELFSSIVQNVFYGDAPLARLPVELMEKIGISSEVASYITIELDQVLFSQKREEFNIVQGFHEFEDRAVEKPVSQEPQEEERTENQTAMPRPQATTPPSLKKDPYREPVDD